MEIKPKIHLIVQMLTKLVTVKISAFLIKKIIILQRFNVFSFFLLRVNEDYLDF